MHRSKVYKPCLFITQQNDDEKDENKRQFGFVNNCIFIEKKPQDKVKKIHNILTVFNITTIVLRKIADNKTTLIYVFIVFIHIYSKIDCALSKR